MPKLVSPFDALASRVSETVGESVQEAIQEASYEAQVAATGGIPGPAACAALLGGIQATGVFDGGGRSTSDEMCVVTYALWPNSSIEAQSDVIRKVAGLIYPPGGRPVPALSDSIAGKLIAWGRQASEVEKGYYPRVPGPLGESDEVWTQFWKLNEAWRSLEAWAGPYLGTKQVMPEVSSHVAHWRKFSWQWKSRQKRDQDLHGTNNDLAYVLNRAGEHGYPKAYQAVATPLKPGQDGYGTKNWVPAVSAENQNSVTRTAQDIEELPSKIADGLGDLINPLSGYGFPKWMKWTAIGLAGLTFYAKVWRK